MTIRIATASDGHYGGQWEDTDRWQNEGDSVPCEDRHSAIISWLNSENSANGLDFVVFNGDLWHDEPYNTIPSGYPGAGMTYRDRVKYWYDQLNIPYYVTKGNHDRDGFSNWESLWGYPVNYSFDYKGWGFVLLNSGSEWGSHPDWPTGYLLPDLSFLQDAVDDHKANGRLVIVFCHVKWNHPQFGGDREDDFGHGQDLHDYARNEPALVAVHYGHRHRHRHSESRGQQFYAWSGHFSHRSTGADGYGYRIIEIPER